MSRLPSKHRPTFQREYCAAAQKAVNDVDCYRGLVEFLAKWSLISVAYSDPGFEQALEDAKQPSPDDVPLEELAPDWPARIARHEQRMRQGR